METMRPPRPWSIIARAARWLARNGPLSALPISKSQSSSEISRKLFLMLPTALFTRMSIPPCSAMNSSIIRLMSALLPTFASCQLTVLPRSRTIPKVSTAVSSYTMSLMPISAPSSASRRAIARPIPRLDPVMSAFLPCSFMSLTCFLVSRRILPNGIVSCASPSSASSSLPYSEKRMRRAIRSTASQRPDATSSLRNKERQPTRTLPGSTSAPRTTPIAQGYSNEYYGEGDRNGLVAA